MSPAPPRRMKAKYKAPVDVRFRECSVPGGLPRDDRWRRRADPELSVVWRISCTEKKMFRAFEPSKVGKEGEGLGGANARALCHTISARRNNNTERPLHD